MVKKRYFSKLFVLRVLPALLLFCCLLEIFRYFASITATEKLQNQERSSLMVSPEVKSKTSKKSDNSFELYFDKEDMLDENGKQFRITIWKFISGVPGYAANPEECLDNIYCNVTFASAPDASSAHAIVFPAGHFGMYEPPKKR